MKQTVVAGLHSFRYILAIMSLLKKTPLWMQHKSDHMFTLAKTVSLWVVNYIIVLLN